MYMICVLTDGTPAQGVLQVTRKFDVDRVTRVNANADLHRRHPTGGVHAARPLVRLGRRRLHLARH